jgi:hypothetical protein
MDAIKECLPEKFKYKILKSDYSTLKSTSDEPAQNENVTLHDELDLSDKENNASDLFSSESESEIDVSDDDEPPNKKGKIDPSQMLENFDKACLQMRNLFEQNASDEFLLKSMKSFTTNASKLQGRLVSSSP